MTDTPYRKKLIEVAIPLIEVNQESGRRKRKAPSGYPTMLHKWWAQRPLAACRAVIFASLVDDPASDPEYRDRSETKQAEERERLFEIIRELVKWENSNNLDVLSRARAEILRSSGGEPPTIFDPFCGSGAIPLEAQRLGLQVVASDLNPVAVLITKALTEIPSLFAGRKPVNPDGFKQLRGWAGAEGLAEDVRFYGHMMWTEAEKRIGHLYPKATLPEELGGGQAPTVAWLWARTVPCPNPACGADMPLVPSFALSTRKGSQVWLEPSTNPGSKGVQFEVRQGTPINSKQVAAGTSLTSDKGKRVQATFLCTVCRSGIAKPDYIDMMAAQRQMGVTPLAKVTEKGRRRIYLAFQLDETAQIETYLDEHFGDSGFVGRLPSQECRGTFASNAQGRRYGFQVFTDYFTRRQLVALDCFSSLVGEVWERIRNDAQSSGMSDNNLRLAEGGEGASAYADSVVTYLAFAVSRVADYGSSLASWRPKDNAMRSSIPNKGLQMVWDFAEGNPFARSSSGLLDCVAAVSSALERVPAKGRVVVFQADAIEAARQLSSVQVCTDPPYYDNVNYSDLSDFYYVWLRRSLSAIFPRLFQTLLTPKEGELIATSYRFDGDRRRAKQFFQEGMARVFEEIARIQDHSFPATLFYAFKQKEENAEKSNGESGGAASTGWEAMLEGLVSAGNQITGTLPVQTEGDNRQVSIEQNALESSVVLAFRPRSSGAGVATRKDLVAALRRDLESELAIMLETNIAPVDLEQATIGPGLAIFTRYSKVVEADGETMPVRTALSLINDIRFQILESGDERLDPYTRFCISWYSQFGYAIGSFDNANKLATANNLSVDGLKRSGVLWSQSGKVRLFKREELSTNWDPDEDDRIPIWEALQHLIARLEGAGIERAAALLAKLGDDRGERSKQLAVRLYELCDRKRWAADAYSYNQLVREFPDIQKTIAEEAARYDNYVREYPQIRATARRFREEQLTLI